MDEGEEEGRGLGAANRDLAKSLMSWPLAELVLFSRREDEEDEEVEVDTDEARRRRGWWLWCGEDGLGWMERRFGDDDFVLKVRGSRGTAVREQGGHRGRQAGRQRRQRRQRRQQAGQSDWAGRAWVRGQVTSEQRQGSHAGPHRLAPQAGKQGRMTALGLRLSALACPPAFVSAWPRTRFCAAAAQA